ncbi:MAG: 2-amino-4-ketopentanoate thiolase [Bacilli bacterium]|nr:2-amino-4-ketopentanoate thiolase [Bacilli bacterium]MBN2696733.1 2-amino-4-ketopentanoate thiolase [Bacilli bacterium]
MAKKGTWVQIHKIILSPEERPTTLPQDTRAVPLEMWVKGWLLADCLLGETARIKTVTGRIVCGEMVAVEPTYKHTYGDFVPEILEIDRIVKSDLFGSDEQ